MKRIISTLILCSFLIYGCGGGGGSSSGAVDDSGGSSVSSGVAVDPYLKDAIFCVDIDQNGICGADEPESTPSDENGVFTFDNYEVQEGDIILMKSAGTHNGVPFQYAKMIAVYQGGDLIVSPLTTLLAKSLDAAQIVALLDPIGTYGLTADLVSMDPVEIVESIGTEVLTDANLAAIRASIGAYMLLRMIDANPALADLSGDDLVNNDDVKDLASNMMAIVAEAITVERIEDFQTMVDNSGVDGLPAVDIMDIIYTAVTICDYALELGEAEFEANGNVNGVINAMNSFKNTQMTALIDEVGPNQYVYRLKREHGINIPNGVPFSTVDFNACSQGLHIGGNGRPMCYGDDEETEATDEEIAEAVADAPEIKFDFDEASYTPPAGAGDARASSRIGFGTNAVGACYVYGIRYNASEFVPNADYLRCVVSETAEAGYLEGISEGAVYLKLTNSDNQNHFAKLTYSNGTATADICYNQNMAADYAPVKQNARVTVTYSEDGYVVNSTMLLDNNWNGTPEGLVEEGLKIDASASVSESEGEMYSFIIHFLNEQGANCADLPSGSSATATDDQCFLRYEGNIYYGLSESDVSFSKYDGLFVEKVYDGGPGAFLAGGSVSAVISGGSAYSRYAGLTTDTVSFDLGTPESEAWTASSLLIDALSSLGAVFGEIPLPERTVTIPAIEDAWDCSADAFVTVDTDSIAGMADCVSDSSLINFVGAADLTTCSEGTDSPTFQQLMDNYRCNDEDPLTLNANMCAPD
ncbi:MAG: hypothetical protein AB7E76_07745 [Deferribacterales bacterium]